MIYDKQKFSERLIRVKQNLRNLASTECASADDLLRRDDLLDRAITPALEAWDNEYAELWNRLYPGTPIPQL